MHTPPRKPRSTKSRISGTYPIDTGQATIVADPMRDGAYTLEVNKVPSSYVVPGAPEVLTYDYMQWIVGFTSSTADAVTPASALTSVHLGAGGCALPSFFAHRWGGPTTAVEFDAALAKLVRRAFDPPVQIKTADARAFTHALPSGSVHVIVRDVFAGPTTPAALTTVEFYRAAHRALLPGGLFVANVGDHPGLPETRAELAGLREVFRFTAVAGPPPRLAGREYGNVVIAASDAPLDFDPGAAGLTTARTTSTTSTTHSVICRDGADYAGDATARRDHQPRR